MNIKNLKDIISSANNFYVKIIDIDFYNITHRRIFLGHKGDHNLYILRLIVPKEEAWNDSHSVILSFQNKNDNEARWINSSIIDGDSYYFLVNNLMTTNAGEGFLQFHVFFPDIESNTKNIIAKSSKISYIIEESLSLEDSESEIPVTQLTIIEELISNYENVLNDFEEVKDDLVLKENLSNKKNAITNANKTSTDYYPSIKAVVDYFTADVSALQDALAGIEATNTEISGEILSFNYQGETVRKISVAASGASSSVLTVCGKNIYPKYTSGSQSNLSWTVAQDGTITFSGTPSADVMLRLLNLSIPAAGKELTLAMFNNMTSARLTVFAVNPENSHNMQLNLSTTNATLTATHTYDLVEMRIRIPKDIDWTGLTLRPMLVYGSSAGNFEAYSGQSHNVTLSGGVVQEDIPLHNGVNTVWASNGDTAITFVGQSGTVTGYVAAQINSIQNQFYRCAASGSAKYVYVYFKSGDYYVCYELHNVPSAASNSNTWQLGHTTACKIASDGTISDVVELIDGGEYELAMRENGAADYCGGNNHGDENTVTFKLFADGKQISDFSAAADGKLRPFNRIDAFDISLVDRCDTPGDNIAQHQKHWTFENGKVEVQQSLKFLQNLRLDVVLLCMCCARRDQFPYGIRQGGVAIEDMSSGGFPHLTTRNNDISYFYFGNNATMNIKAKTDSPTISALYINDVTNAQRQQNKLYYGYYQATNSANPTSVSAGDVIQETSVYDIAYMAATE